MFGVIKSNVLAECDTFAITPRFCRLDFLTMARHACSYLFITTLLARILWSSTAFVPTINFVRLSQNLNALPTIEDLKSDGFMKQVSHASELVEMIGKNKMDQNELTNMLKAQLSHSNGIRGFFVNYLTMDGPADLDQVPESVMEAMVSIEDQSDLISLSCMNIIMPTAMSTMHQQAELQENSRKTAGRGVKILLALKSNPEVRRNAKAIHAAATGSEIFIENLSLVEVSCLHVL